MVCRHLVMTRESQMNLKFFTNVNSRVVDPKNLKKIVLLLKQEKSVLYLQTLFALARTIEYFKIPEDILVICLGKINSC